MNRCGTSSFYLLIKEFNNTGNSISLFEKIQPCHATEIVHKNNKVHKTLGGGKMTSTL